jgi:hypothetical protein
MAGFVVPTGELNSGEGNEIVTLSAAIPMGSRIRFAFCRNRISRRQTRLRTERTPR